mmetsp:Transcript_9657/g.18382  ORF Transcript_9657/g.18382 Transcript_9657/m.18382 type:complete len:280 (-) Transcript_9657:252-1091(-)|eukprot:CAMPEP_0175130300 /NCGR_PEP_ID=MMETSP0087-20121206/5936_1 /TAXON_ID=136419 /ORGANISM="Unknown Unknown, Strain D1" /LENGTH=279 /DNA_ID=CAMNT_0016412515 /DNA_START=32 /DNA_END=871 /DNA_ORIENTATION=+
MDAVLQFADDHFFTPHVYPSTWEESCWKRQALSLYCITTIGGYLMYFSGAWTCYAFFFDKAYLTHKKILKDQVKKELTTACTSLPIMSLLTIPFFLAEVRGFSRLYDNFFDYSLAYTAFSLFCFLMWNDCLIYWIHRGLHHPLLYGPLHKEHHRWLVPTPFASHAFHPLDGFAQSLPYHLFVFVMPIHKWVYLVSFALVNYWTVSIHDGNYQVPAFLKPFVNGSAHHTDHHLYFNYNYGQYFTLWDRLGGSFRNPSPWEGKGPMDDILKARKGELKKDK